MSVLELHEPRYHSEKDEANEREERKNKDEKRKKNTDEERKGHK